ncbi:MutT/NUDIX hydrolase [Caulobacter phage CcrBL9]|uniref:MutT/nudix family protein n=1 Tax=Caulobacter phage CcrBL9 TaxID=2283270 RepID=A0A385ECG0_9CAUD|nr:MutT/NUDIX hydrolase [Caulobacter phage CcrBL9]AXQ69340.1 MutT/nudix family protein [Caulobacter phage CcrBL9]
MNQPIKHLILHSVEDAGIQGMVRAVLGPDFSSILVPAEMIHEEWDNPEPVAVLLQPVYNEETGRLGVVLGRRAVAPKIGEWAIPGGFMERGETPEEGAVRETQQEWGIAGLYGHTARIWKVYPSTGAKPRLLIFCVNGHTLKASEVREILGASKGDGEMSEFQVFYDPIETAFPIHTTVLAKFFAEAGVGAKEFPMSGYGLIASRSHPPQR